MPRLNKNAILFIFIDLITDKGDIVGLRDYFLNVLRLGMPLVALFEKKTYSDTLFDSDRCGVWLL